ncbi:MAG TPA: hypothetical protein PK762_00640 [Candidatus Kapabacteria bacterium]|nr:hypothetical protein [Candidatus Kapabacteria bacterium]
MQTYSFDTKISKDGIIQVPLLEDFSDIDVKVIIIAKPDIKPKTNVQTFLDKWSGFLSDENTDDAKYNYLMEKYE